MPDPARVKTIITLDVLADTMQWIAWGEHFAPLSGHQGKIQEEGRRKFSRRLLIELAWGRRKPPRTSRHQRAPDLH
jgi:hypothetical protein